MLKKGDIYWVKLKENVSQKDKQKYFHPIVCLEDTDVTDGRNDMFQAVILSHGETDANAYICNEFIEPYFFVTPNEQNGYVVPDDDNQHIVKVGLLKHANKMPTKPIGKVTNEGIEWILNKINQLSPNLKNVNMENYVINDYVRLFSPDALEKSLKKAVISYWKTPENRKIDGKVDDSLKDDITIQNLDFCKIIGGKYVNQFEMLLNACKEGTEKPALRGRFRTSSDIDNGNASCSVDCEFELFDSNYQIEDDGSITIKNLIIHKIQ